MSRPETFTLQCDRCDWVARHGGHINPGMGRHEDGAFGWELIRFTSHRQATLDGNAAGWRMTSMEEVCAACVAKESEPPPPLRERDPAEFDVEAVRNAAMQRAAMALRAGVYKICSAHSCARQAAYICGDGTQWCYEHSPYNGGTSDE